jgi:hypothetical protein
MAEVQHGTSDFTAQELLRGYKYRYGVKVYCCYGVYCEAGHSGDCPGRDLEREAQAIERAALSGGEGAGHG